MTNMRWVAVLPICALLCGCRLPVSGKAERSPVAKLNQSNIAQDLWFYNQFTRTRAYDAGSDVAFTTYIDLENRSKNTIVWADFVVESVEKSSRKVLYRTDPIRVDKFQNFRIAYPGALLPYCEPSQLVDVKFTMPGAFWRPDTFFRAKLVADEILTPTGLDDMPNAAAAMAQWTDYKLLSEFKSHPELIKKEFSEGQSMLALALSSGRTKVAEYLIAEGASPDMVTSLGRNALSFALCSNNPKTIDYAWGLKKWDIQYQTKPSRYSYLASATHMRLRNSVAWLLNHGANPNLLTSVGDSPLSLAVGFGDDDIAKMLIDRGADIHWRNSNGYGLMHLSRTDEMCELLVAKDLDVNDKSTGYNITPLMIAAQGQYPVAKWLYEHGADLKAKDFEGKTAQDYAKDSNTLKTDQFFLESIGHKG